MTSIIYPGKTMNKGRLYLIPSTLGESPVNNSFPAFNLDVIRSVHCFIVEEVRTARRFIKKVCHDVNIETVHFLVFNEHSQTIDLSSYMTPLMNGEDVGLLSEAGMPCIADPGSSVVALAHSLGIAVIPLTGPSSIFLSLMASGFNGQNFIFHGYLPIEKPLRVKKIREIEKSIYSFNQTQIFIETPYRNLQLFQSIIETCGDSTQLCIACDLTSESEFIKVMPIKIWRGKGSQPQIHKRPAVFLLYK